MTIHKFQTDEERQAAALDQAETIIERSMKNRDRYDAWRKRIAQSHKRKNKK